MGLNINFAEATQGFRQAEEDGRRQRASDMRERGFEQQYNRNEDNYRYEDLQRERADEQYQREEQARIKKQQANAAMVDLYNGNTGTVLNFMNENTPDGYKYSSLVPIGDGKFEGISEVNGKLGKRILTIDDIGKNVMLLASDTGGIDRFAADRKYSEEQRKTKDNRRFVIKKLDREYNHKKDIARIRANKSSSKSTPKVSEKFWSMAAKTHGQLVDNMLTFTDDNDLKVTYQAAIAEALYNRGGGGNNNLNYYNTEAFNQIKKIDSKIKAKLESYGLVEGSDEYNSAGAELFKKAYYAAMKSINGRTRGLKKPNGENSGKKEGGYEIPKEAIELLNKNKDSEKARSDFERHFKLPKGGADKYIKKTAGIEKKETSKGDGLKELSKKGSKSLAKKVARLKTPMPYLGKNATPEEKKKSAEYKKFVNAAAAKVKAAIAKGEIEKMTKAELRIALNAKLTPKEQLLIVDTLS